MGPTWGPPGSYRPQMGPMWAPWTLLSGISFNEAMEWWITDPTVRRVWHGLHTVLSCQFFHHRRPTACPRQPYRAWIHHCFEKCSIFPLITSIFNFVEYIFTHNGIVWDYIIGQTSCTMKVRQIFCDHWQKVNTKHTSFKWCTNAEKYGVSMRRHPKVWHTSVMSEIRYSIWTTYYMDNNHKLGLLFSLASLTYPLCIYCKFHGNLATKCFTRIFHLLHSKCRLNTNWCFYAFNYRLVDLIPGWNFIFANLSPEVWLVRTALDNI